MKVVFIQPKSFFTWEAINIGYLSAYLKKHIDGIEIDFFSEFFDTEQEIIDGCKDADIIGFSVTSPQYVRGLKLAEKVKTDKNHIVFGGFHPTNMKHILEKDCIDSIVIGEGERAMVAICRGAKGIVECNYILDLDTIPFVDREAIKQSRHMDRCEKKFGKRIGAILMGRGCPFNCVFCASKSVWGRKPRLRSPENILEEFIKVTKDYRLDFVTFSDDEIGVDKQHLIKFCELKYKSGNKVEWGCNAVASCMDEEMLESLKKANCTELWFGVESGSPQILKDIRKPNNIKQIKRAFKITTGFKRRAYCILGMPNESFETIKMTENLLDEIKPDIVGFTIVAPYPGTKFYEEHMKYMDWSTVDEYTNDITCTNNLTNDQLKVEQSRLTDKYVENLTFRNKED